MTCCAVAGEGVGRPVAFLGVTVGEDDAGRTAIEVVNHYQWLLDPRFGRMTVHVDGKSVGFAPLNGSRRVEVAPGLHTVRVSMWAWYRSRRVRVDVVSGSTLVLECDIDRAAPALRRMVYGMFRPFSCLVLRVREVA